MNSSSKKLKWMMLMATAIFVSYCSKTNTNKSEQPGPDVSVQEGINYGDSVFYVNENIKDYTISPIKPGAGRYWGFPDGINIDELSGLIHVNKSETGLKYKVFFTPTGSNDTLVTTILLSGINYLDKVYNLALNETIAYPVYNGDPKKLIPGTDGSSVFDEGGGCSNEGIAVNKSDGRIDLLETVKNGSFGKTPSNGAAKEADLNYRIQDKSNKSLNTLRVKLYYFNTAADITPDLVKLVQDREGAILGIEQKVVDPFFIPGFIAAKSLKVVKPRPPCIFIVSH